MGVGWARSRSTWESPDCGQVSRDGDAGLANGGQAEPLPPTRSAPRPRSRPGSHGRGGVGGRALPGGLGFPASKGRGAESKCLRRAALPRLLPMAPASSCPAPTGSGLSSSSLPDLTEAVRPGQLRGAALGEGRASACGGGVQSRSPGLLDRSLPVALDPALRSQGSLLGGSRVPERPRARPSSVPTPVRLQIRDQSGWGRQIKSSVKAKRVRGVPTGGLGRALRLWRQLWGARRGRARQVGPAAGAETQAAHLHPVPAGLSPAPPCASGKTRRPRGTRAGGQREYARGLRAEPGLGTRARASVTLPRRRREPRSHVRAAASRCPRVTLAISSTTRCLKLM